MAKSIVHKVSLNKKTLCGRNLKEVSATTEYDWVTCKVCRKSMRPRR